MSEFINKVRFYHYMSGVLASQQADPLCSWCRPFVNTAAAIREGLDKDMADHAEDIGALSGEIQGLLEKAEGRMISLRTPEEAEGQKKAGRCHMPKGVCFIKSSKALLESLQAG